MPHWARHALNTPYQGHANPPATDEPPAVGEPLELQLPRGAALPLPHADVDVLKFQTLERARLAVEPEDALHVGSGPAAHRLEAEAQHAPAALPLLVKPKAVVLQERGREKHLRVRRLVQHTVVLDHYIPALLQLLDRPAAERHDAVGRCRRSLLVDHAEGRSEPTLEALQLVEQFLLRLRPGYRRQHFAGFLPDGEHLERLVSDHTTLAGPFNRERVEIHYRRLYQKLELQDFPVG